MDQLFRLIDLFVRKGLPVDIVGQILIYTLPLIVSYTAPMAILVAVVMTFGRLAQDNEILALKTSGLTFFSITKTPFIITLVFMIFLFFFNSFALPEANHRVRNLMLDVSRKRPAIRLPEGVFTKDFSGYTIYIGRKDERHSRLYDITIYDLKNGVLMTAPVGELKDLEQEGIVQFILHNGELHQLMDNTNYQRTKFNKQIINMKVDTELVRRERERRNENELNTTDLKAKIANIRTEIDDAHAEVARLGHDVIAGYVKGDDINLGATRFQVKKNLSLIKGNSRKISRYLIELYKKFSLAFACVLFVIIGAPLGYLFKRGGTAGILIGILLFSSYYILTIGGEEFADRRAFPPFWAMWLPNIIFLCIGIYLYFVAEYERSPFRNLSQ